MWLEMIEPFPRRGEGTAKRGAEKKAMAKHGI